ncbi:heavy-metal-associated domain-containing protein [Rosettibacter firmus]|uniref:heavy-metal-associated domain-containing protein n=1 Tax=Rosettibacter firmus TaxID=3111522 RepID=UPI00336C0B0D
MTTTEIKIDGMSCKHCIMAIEKALTKIGIEKHKVEIGTATITFDESKIKFEEIEKAIEEAGYKVHKE